MFHSPGRILFFAEPFSGMVIFLFLAQFPADHPSTHSYTLFALVCCIHLLMVLSLSPLVILWPPLYFHFNIVSSYGIVLCCHQSLS